MFLKGGLSRTDQSLKNQAKDFQQIVLPILCCSVYMKSFQFNNYYSMYLGKSHICTHWLTTRKHMNWLCDSHWHTQPGAHTHTHTHTATDTHTDSWWCGRAASSAWTFHCLPELTSLVLVSLSLASENIGPWKIDGGGRPDWQCRHFRSSLPVTDWVVHLKLHVIFFIEFWAITLARRRPIKLGR